MLRTHTCGELNEKAVGKSVELCGWVGSRRDHGNIIFIDLRDGYGLTQVVFNPQVKLEVHAIAEELRPEFVVKIEGKVSLRPAGTANPKLKTGLIEVHAEKAVILNRAATPPFEINDNVSVTEETRLKYRYLDFRRSGE